MSLIPEAVRLLVDRLNRRFGGPVARRRLSGEDASPLPRALRVTRSTSARGIAATWTRLIAETHAGQSSRDALADPLTVTTAPAYCANIESFIGTVKVPVGLIGPLRVNGLHANGDFFIPLATTEAALVASYARGARVASLAGGVTAALTYEGVIRAPAFVFTDIFEAGSFVSWVAENAEALRAAAEATTRFGKLTLIEPLIDANVVFLRCRYETGDAAGQNMVTIATDALCAHALAHMPVKPQRWYIEGNFSGDKKASFLGYLTGRGRKVTASVVIPSAVVSRHLGLTVDDMLAYAEVANLGARLSGQIGAQGHFANGIAALYLATGQDAACVAESSVGSTRMERRGGDLFMSVTLPNLLVGTVGGGTGLPSQSAGLDILTLKGSGNANALAEVVAATCLSGEISIMAAIAAGDFARAHRTLARER
ncbi:MAG: hydroxymethylglutaryl-CoA reductase [Hyphomicrobiaceae bacterium]|nr:hydroxymethylglutaryl-CoA reductase [Hyphomicrobiaceae bacterium]